MAQVPTPPEKSSKKKKKTPFFVFCSIRPLVTWRLEWGAPSASTMPQERIENAPKNLRTPPVFSHYFI